MRKTTALITLVLLVAFGALILGCTGVEENGGTDINAPTDNNAPIVGGDADEHGCIGSAGYTWCEEKQKCLRTWEEPCTSDTNEPSGNGEVSGGTQIDINDIDVEEPADEENIDSEDYVPDEPVV